MRLNDNLISVNVTTYNRAHLLSRCLESVVNQTYDNLEIIVVDDCSTDNTREIVEQFQQKDNRIKYYRHETNKGLANARNTAIIASNGEFIAIMDDDDEWLETDKLFKQLAIFMQNSDNKKLALVCSSVRLFSDKAKYIDKIIQKPTDLANKMLYGNGLIYSPTVLIKKSVLEEIGGYDTSLKRGVDSDVFRVCILNYGYEVHFMDDITTGIHEYGVDRITHTASVNSLLKDTNVHMTCLNKFKLHFNSNKTAKRWRKKSVIKNYVKLLWLTKDIGYLFRLVKVVLL
jgi:glycosyltransferase involved in cell wall biosynthesis